MEWSILTTFFSFISLVIATLMFTRQDLLAKKLNTYIDLAIQQTETLRTAVSILQQMESKQDLMFKNAPPISSEKGYNWKEEIHKPGVRTVFIPPGMNLESVCEELSSDNSKLPQTTPADYLRLAQRKLVEHKTKVSSNVPTKKRGRPKKAPGTVTIQLD